MAVTLLCGWLGDVRMPKNFKQAIPMLLGFGNGGSVGFFSVMGHGEDGLSSVRVMGVDDTGFGQTMCCGPV